MTLRDGLSPSRPVVDPSRRSPSVFADRWPYRSDRAVPVPWRKRHLLRLGLYLEVLAAAVQFPVGLQRATVWWQATWLASDPFYAHDRARETLIDAIASPWIGLLLIHYDRRRLRREREHGLHVPPDWPDSFPRHLLLIGTVVAWANACQYGSDGIARLLGHSPLDIPGESVGCVALSFLGLAGVAFDRYRGRLAARARRTAAGLCGRCGYDLQASSDRCPECGSPIAVGRSANRLRHRGF